MLLRYTRFPHRLGLEAVDYYLEEDGTLPPFQLQFIMELLQFATKQNYFWFDGKFYPQREGVAKGAKFAPSLANVFMAKWEEL